MDSVITNIHSRCDQSPFFFDKDKCCIPDQANVWHHTNLNFTKRKLDTFIKYLLRAIFAATKTSIVLIRISMISGIVVSFYRSPLSMVARERVSVENNLRFLDFSIPRANQRINKIFLKVLKKLFLSFKR